MQFNIKKINNNDIKNELLKIGFDKAYLECALKKHDFQTFKIQNLPHYCATIIKQTALSKGSDAGVNREVLMGCKENTDIVLSGTLKQLEEIAKSLLYQPFGLKKIGEEILSQIQNKPYNPLIMGILNITDNSFSDGGKFLDPKKAISHAEEMLKEGANIIDIGAESTKPGAKPIDISLEIERLKGVIKEIKALGATVSIDTRNSKTAQIMLDLGADIINDVSGLNYDRKMADVIKNSNSKIVVMHSIGTPETMDKLNNYNSLTDDIYNFLKEKIEFLNSIGINNERIIIDTGFGFAKDVEQNFELLKKIKEFNSLNVLHLAGVSRKRFLKSLIKNEDEQDDITLLSSFYLFENKVDIIRVHNVQKTILALKFYQKLYRG